jgi:hypothetical protein
MKFDRIQCLDEPAPTTRWQADVGTVTIENNSIRFDGKRHLLLPHIISVERVSSGAFAHDLVQVNHPDGNTVATVYFAIAYRRGGAEAGNQLFSMIEELCGSAPPVSIAPEAIEQHREKLLADRAKSNRQAARAMLIGAIVLLIGVVVTTGTYMRAASAGGIYIIAYGAIFGGIIMILRGFMMKQK